VQQHKNCLERANELIHGDRQESYGHPAEDFSRTAKIWGAILDTEVTPEQVALCMVGVKISRECNRHKDDNIVDGIGYFGTLEMIHEYKENQKPDPPKLRVLHPDNWKSVA
jgi:hypothetical protein